jgi:hypothetical protein
MLDDGHECPTRYNEPEIIQMLNDCTAYKRAHQLNDWEQDFIVGCYRMTDKHIRLSDKQLDILNPLWEKVTANG